MIKYHAAGVVHGDIKSDNVLVETDRLGVDHAKLVDYGLARLVDEGPGQDEGVCGTPEFMAPEVASGDAASPASDLYAVGAVLYEMLTGQPPFQGETPVDTMLLVVSQEPVPPVRLQPGVPRDLETICLKCLHKEPGKRYESAQALADDLDRWLRGEPIEARPVGQAERLWRWCQRNPGVAALSGGLALALAAGTGISLAFALNAEERARGEQHERQEFAVTMSADLLSEGEAVHIR